MTTQKTTYILHIDRRDVRLRYTAIGIRAKLENGTTEAKPGAPDLPVRTLRIALPVGHVARAVNARVLSVESLTSAYAWVAPVIDMGVASSPAGDPEPRYVPPDLAAYAEAVKYGRRQPVRLVGMSRLGEVPIAVVQVQALRFGPDLELELIREIEITVKHEQVAGRTLRRPPAFVLRQHALARRLVVNPGRVDAMPHPEILPPPPPSPAPAPAIPSGSDGSTPAGIGGSGVQPVEEIGGVGTLPVQEAIGAGYLPSEIDYLIVTDDTRWGETGTTTPPGNLAAAFEQLAVAKRARGLQAQVVRLSAINDGAFGDFKTGTRDIQEVLRNFLKMVVESRCVEYVLLGGDHSIIPPRLVCGSASWGVMDSANGDDISAGEYAWREEQDDYGYLALHLDVELKLAGNDYPGALQTHLLTMQTSGKFVPYNDINPLGGTDLRWFYCTDDQYDTLTMSPTLFVRVEGPKDQINDTPQWYVRTRNMVPTDLYYASLYADAYDRPGKHDWESLENGIHGLYGQWSSNVNLGGVDYSRNVQLGRAPVASAAEATVFVNKILAYENSPAQPQATWDRFRKMVIAASNWSGDSYDHVEYKGDDIMPPGKHQYVPDLAYCRTVFRSGVMKEHPGGDLYSYPTVDQPITVGQPIFLNYETDLNLTGWYYAVSHEDPSIVSEMSITVPFQENTVWYRVPVPTEWVVVHSDVEAILTPETFGYNATPELDSSIAKSEVLYDQIRSDFPRVDSITRLYTDEVDLPSGSGEASRLTFESLRDALKDGPHLFAMSGHGGHAKVSNSLSLDTVGALTNTQAPFIAFVNSCHTGSFDTDDCLGEEMVIRDVGAVAYLGFSRACWCASGWKFQHAFFEALHDVSYIGATLDSMSVFAAEGASYRWQVCAINLLGDPEMTVFHDDIDVHPYIGNRRSRELHVRNCRWVEQMWVGHKIHFDTLNQGLGAGYDGCYFCLHEHHTR